MCTGNNMMPVMPCLPYGSPLLCKSPRVHFLHQAQPASSSLPVCTACVYCQSGKVAMDSATLSQCCNMHWLARVTWQKLTAHDCFTDTNQLTCSRCPSGSFQ